jgi:hypothetical protein
VHAETVVACLLKDGKKHVRTFSTMTDDRADLLDRQEEAAAHDLETPSSAPTGFQIDSMRPKVCSTISSARCPASPPISVSDSGISASCAAISPRRVRMVMPGKVGGLRAFEGLSAVPTSIATFVFGRVSTAAPRRVRHHERFVGA